MANASAQGVLFVLGLATAAVAFILLVFGAEQAPVAPQPHAGEGRAVRVRHAAGGSRARAVEAPLLDRSRCSSCSSTPRRCCCSRSRRAPARLARRRCVEVAAFVALLGRRPVLRVAEGGARSGPRRPPRQGARDHVPVAAHERRRARRLVARSLAVGDADGHGVLRDGAHRRVVLASSTSTGTARSRAPIRVTST